MYEVKVCHWEDPSTSITIELVGGTLVSWKVRGEERLFVSSLAKRDGNKAIRGGIPLCFPQFGPWGEGRPQHGFARNMEWKLEEKYNNKDGAVAVRMSLKDNETTRKQWNHKFELSVTFMLALDCLTLETSVKNTGEEDFDFTYCIHTYFRVDDISKVKIAGLKGVTYVDKTQDGKRFVEENEYVTTPQFVDRVYENAPDTVQLMLDEKQCIKLEKKYLRDYVVWNPWKENCAKMGDMDNDGYLNMICVEAAQASKRETVKAGGEEWNSSQQFTVEKIKVELVSAQL